MNELNELYQDVARDVVFSMRLLLHNNKSILWQQIHKVHHYTYMSLALQRMINWSIISKIFGHLFALKSFVAKQFFLCKNTFCFHLPVEIDSASKKSVLSLSNQTSIILFLNICWLRSFKLPGEMLMPKITFFRLIQSQNFRIRVNEWYHPQVIHIWSHTGMSFQHACKVKTFFCGWWCFHNKAILFLVNFSFAELP